jgi:glycosyltransferase involved in cell wall biosynthesis
MSILPVSVVVIAKDEAYNIRRCLASVRGWVNEIVVVVDHCSDGTEDIAREEFGAKVVYNPWVGFKEQKNVGIRFATRPWILSLDADEEVSVALRQSLADFLSRPTNHSGARFARLSWYLGRWIRHGDWYPDWSLRLFRKDVGIWIGGAVHERLQLDGSVATLGGDLYHYSYPTLADHLVKINLYSRLFVKGKPGRQNRVKMALLAPLHGAWAAFRGYFLRCGFLDGFAGLCIAVFSGFATFVKYAMWYESSET